MAIETPTASTSELEIRLLGGSQLVRGGRSEKFKVPAKAASLLGYLIVHRAQPCSRELLAFTFWPDESDERARANLRRHVLLLQRALPPEAGHWIVAEKRSICWNAPECSIDVVDFEALSSDVDQALRASALYAGDLLPDIYDDWVLPERERLRRLQSVNLERLVALYRRHRDFSKAISAAELLLLHDPWREDAVRTLMSLHQESGDRAGALREYQRFSNRLRSEMDVEPMPETRARYEAIVRNSVTRVSADSDPARAAARNSQSAIPFVGRESELAKFREWWDRAARGHGRFALLGGEAGIGKSRLVAEFGSIVEAQGGRVVSGATTFPETTPYQAVIESLRSALPLISALEIAPAWLAAACAVLPELRASREVLPSLPTLQPEQQRARLFEALANCFEGIARARPLFVVLEDLHWAGAATAAFLEYLTARVQTHPILVVATYRDDETESSHPVRALRRGLHRSQGYSSLSLARFSKEDVGRFVAAIPELEHRAVAFSERAHALSDGNPFFLNEIVRESLDSRSDVATLPKSAADVVRRRIHRLSETAQTLAQFAAVAGHAFDIEMLAGAAGVGEDIAIAAVDELLDGRLIRDAHGPGGLAEYDFAFSHDLIQSEIYASMSAAVRKRRHRRVGLVMERLHAGSIFAIAADLARHFDEGGDATRAARYYQITAKQALALYADAEAVASLSRAIELEGFGPARYELISEREAVHGRAGARKEQAGDLGELERLAAANGNDANVCESLRRRFSYAQATDDSNAQLRAISEMRRVATRCALPYWEAVADECSAASCVTTGNYEDATSYAQHALATYVALHDLAGRIRSLCLIAEVCALQAKTADAQTSIAQAISLAAGASGEALVHRTLAAASLARYLAGDYVAAEGFANQALSLCRAIGDREGEANALARLGNIDNRHFAIEAATQKYAAANRIYDALGKRAGQAIVAFNFGLLFLRIGQYDDALRSFGRARAIFVTLNDQRGVTVCAINLGMVSYLTGRYAAARRLAARGLLLARALQSPHLECVALGNLAAAERELGDLSLAVAHSEAALVMRRGIALMDMASDLGDMGLTYLRAGDLERAVSIADEISALDDAALESVMFPQNVLWIAAQIFAAAAEPARRDQMFERASTTMERRCLAIPEGKWRASYREIAFNREISASN